MNFINLNAATIHYKYLPYNPLASGDWGSTFLFINSLGTDFRIWDEIVDVLKEYKHFIV